MKRSAWLSLASPGVVQVFAFMCATMPKHRGVTAGPTTPSITLCLRGSQGCGHYVVNVRALSCCACSMQENLPSFLFFFPFFPSLVTGKGSIFSFHIWSCGALPVSSSLLMLYKHPYFVWDLYFLECSYSNLA